MEEEENQNKKIEKEVKKEAKKIQNGELKSLKHLKKSKSKNGGRRKSKIKIEKEVKKNPKNPKWRCGVSHTSRMLYHLSYIPKDVSTPSNFFFVVRKKISVVYVHIGLEFF